MTREKLAEIFNETQERFFKEKFTEDKIKEAIASYASEDGKIDSNQMAAFAYIEGVKNSIDFTWEILKNIVEDEEKQKKVSSDL